MWTILMKVQYCITAIDAGKIPNLAASTQKRRRTHSTGQRGGINAAWGRFAFHVDKESSFCAFYRSTRLSPSAKTQAAAKPAKM